MGSICYRHFVIACASRNGPAKCFASDRVRVVREQPDMTTRRRALRERRGGVMQRPLVGHEDSHATHLVVSVMGFRTAHNAKDGPLG